MVLELERCDSNSQIETGEECQSDEAIDGKLTELNLFLLSNRIRFDPSKTNEESIVRESHLISNPISSK